MKSAFRVAVATLALALASQAHANSDLTSANGLVRIGINDDGSLNAATADGYIGLQYFFSGQGGRDGFQDALTPGCACEAWGVAANGIGGQVGQVTGNQNIDVGASSSTATSFTSNTSLLGLTGLTVRQTYSVATENSSGALFADTVTIHNGTGAAITDLRYTRAMDWDVPPTEFNEWSTFSGTGTTSTLLRSTDDGFANANPLTAVNNLGIVGPITADGSSGPADHGALFTFGFGDLADGADYTFKIFYGAAADQTGAIGLLSNVSPELYNLGQSTGDDGKAATDMPTFIFAFSGVGGTVVVPPSAVPEPATWAMMIGGLGLAGGMMRRRYRKSEADFTATVRSIAADA